MERGRWKRRTGKEELEKGTGKGNWKKGTGKGELENGNRKMGTGKGEVEKGKWKKGTGKWGKGKWKRGIRKEELEKGKWKRDWKGEVKKGSGKRELAMSPPGPSCCTGRREEPGVKAAIRLNRDRDRDSTEGAGTPRGIQGHPGGARDTQGDPGCSGTAAAVISLPQELQFGWGRARASPSAAAFPLASANGAIPTA